MLDLVKKLLFLLPPTDKVKLLGLLVLMLIGSILEVVGIGMIPVFVSLVATPEKILEMERLGPIITYFGITNKENLLVTGGLFLVGVFVIKNAYLVMFHYIKARFLFRRYSLIASGLFRKYMNSSYVFITSKNTSEIVRNVTQETSIVVGHVMDPMLKLAMDFILVSATLALLFWVNPLVTVAAVILFAVAGGGFVKSIRRRSQIHGKRVQAERAVMMQSVNEGLGGLKDIRVLQRSNWFVRRFSKSVARFGKAQVFRTMTKTSTKPILETVAVAGMLMVVLILYWQGRSVETVIPLLALFGAAALRLLPSIREVVEAINSLRFHGYAVQPIYEEFKRAEEAEIDGGVLQYEEETTPLAFDREILFENVSFCYPGREIPAVSGMSIKIERGEAVGFIGPSGAGKTTAVDLLLGILTPQEGKITVDGVNIRGKLGGWLRNVGYIPQFIFLTDDTLRRNIALGLPDQEIDDEKLARAIESAQLTEMIEQLPQGVDTIVGERGVRLSGGQRQRIGIARALYGDPSVLIMDEATSSLDSTTEKYVIESIERLKGERTIIMISHRMTTVQNCDRLFVINNSQLSDTGKYHELSARNADLYEVKA